MKIFVVEDETEICKELSVLLQKYGYAYESSTDFAHITDHILKAEADLVLLDINLPYQDGYTICREIRKQSDIPIIVLTSRNTDFDELMSLNIGDAGDLTLLLLGFTGITLGAAGGRSRGAAAALRGAAAAGFVIAAVTAAAGGQGEGQCGRKGKGK